MKENEEIIAMELIARVLRPCVFALTIIDMIQQEKKESISEERTKKES